MNQSFNSYQLLKLCKQAEFVDYGMTVQQLSDKLNEKYEAISKETFEFDIKKVSEYYLTQELADKLILRKLNDNIKRIYKDEQANRRIIISQVRTLLEETCPFWVIKTDIKSFYESIDRNRLIAKFHDDSILSHQSMYLLKKLFENPILSAGSGVPRGMNISATLSEIYMRKFDRWISRFNGVYYYARFVDDIIIFLNSLQASLNLIKIINDKLEELTEGLFINDKKTELYNGNVLWLLNKDDGKCLKKDKTLEYLGYSFSKQTSTTIKSKKFNNITDLQYTDTVGTYVHVYENISNLEFTTPSKKESKLQITIAHKKVKKIKTRVILALLDFSKNRNFTLLENRIKFLTGNYSIRKTSEGNDLKAGIFYNYPHITDLSVFDELNDFYRKAIFSRGSNFSRTINLSIAQKKRLKKYCFKAGFLNKTYNSFSFGEMESIIQCW